MRYRRSQIMAVKKHVIHMDKLISEAKPFDINSFVMKESNLSISKNCRKEWGWSISVDVFDRILTEEDAGNICQNILDRYNESRLAQRLWETIQFLKVESVGGIWNTPQLITMLEAHFDEKKQGGWSA